MFPLVRRFSPVGGAAVDLAWFTASPNGFHAEYFTLNIFRIFDQSLYSAQFFSEIICEILSFLLMKKFVLITIKVHVDRSKSLRMFYFKIFGGATDTPILDFWWCFLWVSKPEWVLPYSSLAEAYMLHYMFPEIHLWCNTCWPLGGKHGSRAIS